MLIQACRQPSSIARLVGAPYSWQANRQRNCKAAGQDQQGRAMSTTRQAAVSGLPITGLLLKCSGAMGCNKNNNNKSAQGTADTEVKVKHNQRSGVLKQLSCWGDAISAARAQLRLL